MFVKKQTIGEAMPRAQEFQYAQDVVQKNTPAPKSANISVGNVAQATRQAPKSAQKTAITLEKSVKNWHKKNVSKTVPRTRQFISNHYTLTFFSSGERIE